MDKNTVIKQALQSSNLPTLPTVANQLITLTAREDTTLADIAGLISQDISLSAKILKVANSAFYSFPQQIASINQAVSLLGTNAVRSLVLSFSFLSMGKSSKPNKFNFTTFWEKSLVGAIAAKLILEKVDGANSEEVLVAGLLQNLGELIFALVYSEEYENILKQTVNNHDALIPLEEEMFGLNHCELGYEVASSWGFPTTLCEPILHHHKPNSYEGNHKDTKQTIAALYLSGVLCQIFYSDRPEMYHKKFRTQAASLLKLKQSDIKYILENLHTEIINAGSYFDFRIKNVKSVQDILQEANIRLSILNLDYEQINKQLIEAKINLENLTTELEEKNRRLENLANIDGLTNIYNHRYFQNSLDQEISRSKRRELELSLIMLDIDYFKKLNDTYGHQIGDFILIELSQIIKNQLREYDTVARYGGEEFVIILPETNLESALTTAEKVRSTIEDHEFIDQRQEIYKITVSLGVSMCRPHEKENFSKSDFIGEADSALYNAKNNGRNKVAHFTLKKKGWFS
ncbi:MAG: GGDEF domain-containing protein [Desulfotalea sp.]